MRNDTGRRRAPLGSALVMILLVLIANGFAQPPFGAARAGASEAAVKIHQRVGLRQGGPVALHGDVTLAAIAGTSISGDTLYVPANAHVVLGAASIPGGCESFIAWQAPGGAPPSGTGAAFGTRWDAPGLRTVFATCGASRDSLHVLVYRVTLTELVFDWQPGDAADGVDIRANRTVDVQKPEWRPGARNEPVAWIRARRPAVRAKFTVEPATITSLTVSATAPAPWQGLVARSVSFSGGLSLPDTLSFQLLGSTPAAVSRDTLAIEWSAAAPNGLPGDPGVFGMSGPHAVYTLHATPRAPMAEPWTEVLWHACDFARGATTEAMIVDSLVWNVYHDSNLVYYPAYSYSSGWSGMNLTQFLYDVAHSASVYVDCRDCSHWAHLQTNALGLDARYMTLGIGTPSWQTNLIYEMGGDRWRPQLFNIHQVGWFWSSMVGDFAAAGDSDPVPWQPPCTFTLARGDETLARYLDILTEDTRVHTLATGLCEPY